MGFYPLINWHNYRKSPCLMDNSTINGNFQQLCQSEHDWFNTDPNCFFCKYIMIRWNHGNPKMFPFFFLGIWLIIYQNPLALVLLLTYFQRIRTVCQSNIWDFCVKTYSTIWLGGDSHPFTSYFDVHIWVPRFWPITIWDFMTLMWQLHHLWW